jgi:hypothetical protein
MDEDKNKLIEKLKVIKDPIERNRIIWAIAGLEKDVADERPKPAGPRKTVLSPPPDQKQNLPALPAGVRKWFAYFVPGLFVFFGLMNLLQALMHILPSGKVEAAVPQLIMGAIFLMFGIASFIKARKKAAGSDQDTNAEGHS